MSKTLKKYCELIKSYNILGIKAKKAVEKNVDPDLLNLLCEICFNIQNKNVLVTAAQKKRLSSYKNLVKSLSDKKVSKKSKKKKIIQKGRGFFIPLLFSIIGPLLSSLLK